MIKTIVSLFKLFMKKTGMTPLVALFVGVLFFLIGGVGGYKMNNWVVADADFCEACHVHDYANEAWKHSIHNYTNTTCHDCHHQSMYDNVKSLVILMSPFHKPEEMLHSFPAVNDHICQKCHDKTGELELGDIVGPLGEEEIAKVAKIDEAPLHKIHLKAKDRLPYKKYKWNIPVDEDKKLEARRSPKRWLAHEIPDEGQINCRDCHGSALNRAHSFAAKTSNCEQCHNAAMSENGPHMHNQNCLLCHVAGFISRKEVHASVGSAP